MSSFASFSLSCFPCGGIIDHTVHRRSWISSWIHYLFPTKLLTTMNFVDPFDIATASSSTPPPRPDNEQSLNEEVNQVIGQLGRFWGGFRQQVRCND